MPSRKPRPRNSRNFERRAGNRAGKKRRLINATQRNPFGFLAINFSSVILQRPPLPDSEIGELVYSENMGACCAAGSTSFNGSPPAKVVHVSQ
jgi:hypothetical protein